MLFLINQVLLQEHVIQFWEDITPEFHNLFAIQVKDKICELMEEQLRELPEGKPTQRYRYCFIFKIVNPVC